MAALSQGCPCCATSRWKRPYFYNEFPDPNLFDRVPEEFECSIVQTALEEHLKGADYNGISKENCDGVRKLVDDSVRVFSTTFAKRPPTKSKPCNTDLMANSKSARVKLANYSQEQREFLKTFVDKPKSCNIVNANPTLSWASPPLLLLETCLAAFRFTVNLRSRNRYTKKHS